LAAIRARMVDNAKVQEGTKPAEDANALLAESESLAAQLQALIAGINRTNLGVKLPDGRSLTDAIAERDVLLVRIAFHRNLADAAVIKQTVQTRSEVRFSSTVDVAELRKKADALSKAHRELDVLIQSTNWSHDLIEN
jgi:hypothetical protein